MKNSLQQKRGRKIETKAYGILNHFGEFWTHSTFYTIAEAKEYIKNFWKHSEDPPDMSKHKVVPVTITLTSKK